MSMMDEMLKIANLISRLCDDLHEWKEEFGEQCGSRGLETTNELFVEAAQMLKELRGED